VERLGDRGGAVLAGITLGTSSSRPLPSGIVSAGLSLSLAPLNISLLFMSFVRIFIRPSTSLLDLVPKYLLFVE
jgi:hypothetical protein